MLKTSSAAYQDISLETRVLGSSPISLVVMTYEKILEHLQATRRALASNQDAQLPSEKAVDLIQLGLQIALNMKDGGEVAANLSKLYDWSVSEILSARAKKSPEMMDGVIRVIDSLASGWRELHDREEKAEGRNTNLSVHLSSQAVQSLATP